MTSHETFLLEHTLQGRIQRFWKTGALYVGHHGWLAKKMLGFRWSKKAKITLETLRFWRNISISIFKFSLFLYTMKACQWNLMLVMNITQTNFRYLQNVPTWRLTVVNYKKSLHSVAVPSKRSSEAKRKILQITMIKYKLKLPESM